MSKTKAQARSAIKLDLFADAAREHKIETLGDPFSSRRKRPYRASTLAPR
jgi:hypothetical protein